ncbi:MAG: alpha amylase catalytic region [Microbacteriaceae bacterium]|nr:alpha amylase catalytic region [Microbacteriaceae bacterium]
MTESFTLVSGVDAPTEEWWKRADVYQVYPRSFADSNGDGLGDLNGIISRLPYLATLGVDVIWLSPIYASPQDDNGYDISDYQAIDPVFGSLDDFDRLVAEIHRLGMKLVMDLVVNHTSDEHAWFRESASSTSNPKRDWYWWRGPRDGMTGGEAGAEPNNWGSFFSGSAWEYDRATGEYFLHLFSRKQPDLNWENPQVRGAVYSMMRWWLDRGVDGFRMDVINFISKDPALPNAEALPGALYGNGAPYYNAGPRIHEFLREMNEEVFAARPGEYLTVGEMPGVTIEQATLFTDPARREVDMVFQFEHVDIDHGPAGKFQSRPFDLRTLKRSFGRWQTGLAAAGWNSLYWDNHDQPRVVSRFGDAGAFRVQSATMLAAVLHLQRGTPYIFQGEELGMTNVPFSDVSELRDIESLRYYSEATGLHGLSAHEAMANIRRVGRDNARTPMQWSGEENGGFSTGTPWIAANPNFTEINAAEQVGRVGSVFEFYRSLIELRHREPAVTDGVFELLEPEHPTLFAYTRTAPDTQLLVLGNFAEPHIHVARFADWRAAETLISNYPTAPADSPLRPWEVRVLRR